MEIYKKSSVEGYEVSNFGNIRRLLKSGKIRNIKGCVSNRGYRYFQIQRNKKRYNYSFHVLVAEAFIGERPDKLVVDHIDRNKLNNNADNLRYITHVENIRNSDIYVDEINETNPVLRKRLMTKRYNENNREKVLSKKREYYYKNKEKLKEKNLNRKKDLDYEVQCECSSNFKLKNIKAHNRTKKHNDYINGKWILEIDY